jgi:outer membrane protein TolC
MPRPSARALLLLFVAAASLRAQPAPAIAADKPLTLEDTIAMALQKNFDLQVQANSTESAKESLNIAQASFDPTVTANASRSGSQTPNTATRLEGTTSDNASFRAGISQPLVWTNGSLSLSTTLGRSYGNNSFSTLNPNYSNGISAALSQPLLRNAGPAAAKANINRSKLGVDIAVLGYKSQVLNLIRDTETAYYALVTARETLRIRQLSLDLAQKLYDENQARRNTGVMTDLDVLSAEVGVANARRSIVQAEQSVRDAEDNLLSLINAPQLDVRPGPVKFEDYTEGAPNFAASYKLARNYYPNTLSAEDTLKQLQIDLDTARRNLRPNLNLDASLGYTAAATNQGYSDVISNLPHNNGNNWSIALSYSMPWGRHADKSRFRQAQLSLNSQKLRLDQAEQQLIVLVRSAVRTVETNLTAVDIAAQATSLAEKQYEQQKARFDAGLVTSRVVLQAQDDLETARFNELSAKLTLRRAATELHRLEGTSLQRYHVQLPY